MNNKLITKQIANLIERPFSAPIPEQILARWKKECEVLERISVVEGMTDDELLFLLKKKQAEFLVCPFKLTGATQSDVAQCSNQSSAVPS